MNKTTLTTFAIFLFSCFALHAQDIDVSDLGNEELNNVTLQSLPNSPSRSNKTESASGTFATYYDRATAFSAPAASVTGGTIKLTGTMGTTRAIGVDFDNSATVNISQLLVMFYYKVIYEGTDKTFKAFIYNAGSDALPTGTALGTTTYVRNDVNASTTTALGVFTAINFASPITVTGNFVAAVEVDTAATGTRDRVAIATNSLTNADGKQEKRMCAMRLSTSTWYEFNNLIGALLPGIPTLDVDPMIVPVVQGETITVGINEVAAKSKTLSLKGHYPSPAQQQLNIDYILDKTATVKLKIFELTGKVVYEVVKDNIMDGNHQFTIDLANMNNGTYYYTLSNNDASITSKFVVAK